jgi:hypothetical protein
MSEVYLVHRFPLKEQLREQGSYYLGSRDMNLVPSRSVMKGCTNVDDETTSGGVFPWSTLFQILQGFIAHCVCTHSINIKDYREKFQSMLNFYETVEYQASNVTRKLAAQTFLS